MKYAYVTHADHAQLERWAFGRADNEADRERAAAALAELARREAAARSAHSERVAEHPDEESPHQGGALDSAHIDAAPIEPAPLDPAPLDPVVGRHRRRMLVTGIAGVLAAVIAAPVAATQLTLPDPDPLAIFERPASELDQEWATRVQQNFSSVPTLGPRVVVDGDMTLVAFRSSTVPDGRSTEWDAYCLASMESNPATRIPNLGTLMLNCVHPRRFDSHGISWMVRGNSTGDGFTEARWGPIGPPRVEQVESIEAPPTTISVIDWMAYPNPVNDVARAMSLVNEPDRLLMGPSLLLYFDDSSPGEVELAMYLLSSRTEGDEPELCLAATASRSPTATGCRPLSEATAEGLIVYAPATEGGWNVTISPDGQPTVERTGVVLD